MRREVVVIRVDNLMPRSSQISASRLQGLPYDISIDTALHRGVRAFQAAEAFWRRLAEHLDRLRMPSFIAHGTQRYEVMSRDLARLQIR